MSEKKIFGLGAQSLQPILLYSLKIFLSFMPPKRVGPGAQKMARLERLKREVLDFILANPGCSAQSIVGNLTNDKQMRNHGLTPRKVGFFIPRYLQESNMVAGSQSRKESVRGNWL